MEAHGGENDAVFWDDRYRHGDTPWEKGAPAPPLIDYLARYPMSGSALVPGCGSGHDVRLLAQHGMDVVGMDFSREALTVARSYPPVAGEHYVQADWLRLPSEWHGRFDYVVEHTCFCAIDPRRREDYVESVRKALKPGGQFLAVFFINPDSEQGGPPYGCPREEIEALFAPCFQLCFEEMPRRAYAGREGRELLMRWQLC